MLKTSKARSKTTRMGCYEPSRYLHGMRCLLGGGLDLRALEEPVNNLVLVTYACRDRYDRPCRTVKSRSKVGTVEYLVCLGDTHRPPTCTCEGFQFNVLREHKGKVATPYKCEHIKKLEATVCQYHSLLHGAPAVTGRGSERKLVCPLCGGDVVLGLES